ncbi:hypothetical protein TNIN_112371 [Trichonephila inaurata madagascariensis]|uniref:Uncharacterized protein n=1 Tax=Trichonephila inaurata madagascariensis TaxID=2747483 RepID=A0A8X6XE00_9ARAC|nr:hypothetical protein TNIN_112371 [Trichonephila inaurata madagascariensis]
MDIENAPSEKSPKCILAPPVVSWRTRKAGNDILPRPRGVKVGKLFLQLSFPAQIQQHESNCHFEPRSIKRRGRHHCSHHQANVHTLQTLASHQDSSATETSLNPDNSGTAQKKYIS